MRREDEFVALEFDLYHCDDPSRSEDGIRYPLAVRARRDDVALTSSDLAITDDTVWGEVIEAVMQDGSANIVAMLDGAGGSVSGVVSITIADDRLEVDEGAASPALEKGSAS